VTGTDRAPVLYFDLGSPYAYLAVERVAGVLGVEPRLEPIVLGAIFKSRGYGSWAHTPEREQGVEEVERRAAAYGLPPVAWPPGWPPNTLNAQRAVVWAERYGLGRELTRAAFRRAFADGRDLADMQVLRSIARSLGLPHEELEAAISDPKLKEELKRRTGAAQEAGVNGVPTLRIGAELFYGDDQLERAAAALAA